MRFALTFLLLATFFQSAIPAPFAQTVNPQTGAVCEPQPPDMGAVRARAETGDAAAEYELGRSILSRTATDSEVALALPWFRRSAERGYAPAEYIYGSIFREGRWQDPKQLVYWWTKAAEQGNVSAQLWLGAFYEQGSYGIERDYSSAIKWLSRAAKQGQPDAQVTVGQMYEYGEGVPQDYALAAYWYRKAADHTVDLGGAGVGANILVQLYQDGHATSQDYVFVYSAYAYAEDTDGMQDVSKKMNASQIADAQRRVRARVQAILSRPSALCPTTSRLSLPMLSATTSPR